VDSPPRRLTAMGSSVHSAAPDIANVQIGFESGTIALITASRATEEKIRVLSITQPDAYVVLDYSEQDIRIHRRAAQEYTLNRESIRYRRASFVEHVQVHKDNPLKLEVLNLARAVRRSRAGEQVVLAETEDVRSLARALETERIGAVAFSGKFWKTDLLDERRLDATLAGMKAEAGAMTDANIVQVVAATLGRMGIELLDQRHFLGDWIGRSGCWSRRAPTEAEWADVRRGLTVARLVADAGVGQAVVIKHGAVTAVEATEGTTETIRRGLAQAGPGA